jgi:hypothetical protein
MFKPGGRRPKFSMNLSCMDSNPTSIFSRKTSKYGTKESLGISFKISDSLNPKWKLFNNKLYPMVDHQS